MPMMPFRTFILPLAPFLLATFPVVSLFAENQTEVEFRVLWWPLVLCVMVAGVALAGALAVTRSAPKAAVVASLVMICLFYYELVPGADRPWFMVLWFVLFLAAVVLAALSRRSFVAPAIVLLAAGLAMLLPQVVRVVQYHAQHPAPTATDPALWPAALQPPTKPPGKLPDIYVLMPDDHARADVLKQYFHYDNAPFLRQLKQRGFVISHDNRSPYSYSEMNMASLLNLDYLSKFPAVLGQDSQDMRPVKRVLQDNRAARLLDGLGYENVHIDTDEVTYAGRNPDISPVATPDSFMSLWLQQTPLREFGGPIGFADSANDERFRGTVRSGFRDLAAVRPGPAPKFVVFHTLIPHDPFIFGPHGQAITFPSDADHTGREGMKYYLKQLQYADKELLSSVDSILAHATTPPVILIQADEGFEVDSAVVGERASQTIRVKGLSAFLLPGVVHPRLPEPPNTVNDLRFVFNTYLGTSYPMLPSVSYPEHDDQLYTFTDELNIR
jgi:hypothetical protein